MQNGPVERDRDTQGGEVTKRINGLVRGGLKRTAMEEDLIATQTYSNQSSK